MHGAQRTVGPRGIAVFFVLQCRLKTVPEEEANSLADEWLDYWETRPSRKPDDQRYSEISDRLHELLDPIYECDPEVLWLFVQTIYKRPMSDRVFAVLAAGPVEDLIAYHGPEFIDRIETEARQNPRFRELLGGAWRNDATDEVWARVEKFRGPTW
jgi:broad specificity phosphatase PhoE